MKTSALLLAAALSTALVPMAAMAGDAKAKTETAASKTGNAISDAALTTKIKAKLVAEENLSALDIGVDSSDGVVTLSGEVDNAAQVDLAKKVVQDLDGVKAVHNKLEVKGKS